MKIDLVLVGPWERLLNEKKLKEEYARFFLNIKNSRLFNKIIYSCSKSDVKVDEDLFDVVLYNPPIDKDVRPHLQNQNTNNLIENSRVGIQASDADFVIKMRSDLIIKNFELLINLIVENPSKFVVDYDISHSLLIPYYYSDFLVAGSRLDVLKIFNKDGGGYAIKKKSALSISPFRGLTIAKFRGDIFFTEYSIWSKYLFNIGVINALKPINELNFKDFQTSLRYFKESICFINRRQFFERNRKFIKSTGLSQYYFDKNQVLCHNYKLNMLLLYHYILFLKRSIALILSKLRI